MFVFTKTAISTEALRGAAASLSVIAGATYLMIALGFVPDGYLSPPAPVMFAAGLIYMAGAYALMHASKRMLTFGALANGFVLAAFIGAVVTGTATVDALSVIGKLAQAGLGLLILMILFGQRETNPDSRTEAV